MGTSVLLVFLAPLMAFYLLFKAVFSLFGMDFDVISSWVTGTEATDIALSLIAGVYNIFEPILKPIIEMFSGVI